MSRAQDLYREAKKIIPGGTQLLSKRPEMFLPGSWPTYYEKAKGCEVWDLDGKKYVDMSYMGIGSCILGYADDDVNRAVKATVDSGNMSTLNAPEEVELAKLLMELHPWAQMARFARTGGEAMSVAVRCGRAASKKDRVLFCGYHGWHDWYISSNISNDKSLDGHLLAGLNPSGVPRSLCETSIPFKYNDTEAFLTLADKYKDSVGVVVLETIRNVYPEKDFLATLRKITQERGIVLIVDEITSGWRLNLGGAHLMFDLEPDMAVFAKGLSNGYPMAAIIGRSKIMDALQETFVSSTYWTEKIGPVAALATIRKMKMNNVSAHLIKMGQLVKKGWQDLAVKHDLAVKVSGIDPLAHLAFDCGDPLTLKTLYTQLMLERGFLATTMFYASFAHSESNVGQYLKATDEAFAVIAQAAREKDFKKYLHGEVCHAGFKRLT